MSEYLNAQDLHQLTGYEKLADHDEDDFHYCPSRPRMIS